MPSTTKITNTSLVMLKRTIFICLKYVCFEDAENLYLLVVGFIDLGYSFKNMQICV